MKTRRYIQLLILSVFLSSCSLLPTQNSELTIESSPSGAAISIIENSGNPRVIGKTPLKLTSSELSYLFNETVQLQISLEGYLPRSLLIGPSNKSLMNVYLKLTEINKSNSNINSFAKLHAEINQLLMKKNYSRAEVQGQLLVGQYPTVSVGWDLMGNIYYLNRKYSQALDCYKKSINLDGSNEATAEIIRKLENTIPGNFNKGSE